MPKTSTAALPLLKFKVTVPDVIRMARRNLAVVETPEESSEIVLFNVYRQITLHSAPLTVASAFSDTDLVRTLDGCRFPITNRLRFDFTTSRTYGRVCGDLASYALRYNHLDTANTLLREERASWEHDPAKIVTGASRTLSDGTTWFHKILILAAEIYDRYKDDVTKQEELKEYLQSLMEDFDDVLNTLPLARRRKLIGKLCDFFQHSSPLSVCALTFLYRLAPAKLAGLKAKEIEEIAKIAKSYDLAASGLLQRQQKLARLTLGDINKDKRSEFKEYLKVRYRLSALMLDRLFFEASLNNFSPLHIEAFAETLLDLIFDNQTGTIGYLLRSLNPNQARALLDYLFISVGPHPITLYIKEKVPGETLETLEPKILTSIKKLQDVINVLIENLGNYQQQLNYLYTSLAIRSTAFHIPENTQFIANVAFYFCTYIQAFKGLEKLAETDETLSPQCALELEHFPMLTSVFSGKLPAFNAHILNSIKDVEARAEGLPLFYQYIWQAYLYLMWIELNKLPSSIIPEAFEVLDYFIENILKNPSACPQLYAGLIAVLIESDYFSNKKLEYLFKYRIGEGRAIAKKIQLTEVVRKGNDRSELVISDFADALNVLQLTGDNAPLLAILAKTITAKNDSIYAQLDFAKAWVSWAKSKEDKTSAHPFHAFELLLEFLINQTPFAVQIKRYARLVDGEEITGSILGYLLTLADTPTRLASFNYDALLDGLVFNRESAQACLLLFLFFHHHAEKAGRYDNLSLFIEQIFAAISKQFDENAAKQEDFLAFYDEMARHNFFKPFVGTSLYSIIYKNYTIPTASAVSLMAMESGLPTASPPTSHADDLAVAAAPTASPPASFEETACESVAKKKRRRRKPKALKPHTIADAGTGGTGTDTVVETEAEAEAQALVVHTNDIAPPTPIVAVPADDKPKLPSSELVNLEKLRELQQALVINIHCLKALYTKKLALFPKDSCIASQCGEILHGLEAGLSTTLMLSDELKEVDGNVTILPSDDSAAFSTSVFELLQHSQDLIAQVNALAANMPKYRETAKLLGINVPSLEKMLQPFLHERLALPKEMPVVARLAALFAADAKLSMFGSALFLPYPLDIDLKLTWIDPAVSLDDMKEKFKTLVESAGFKIFFTKDLIGAIAFKLQAKGDGYGLDNHKGIDITIQLADPSRSIQPLHHNTHSSASYDVTEGIIRCSPENAQKIINGTFHLHHHPIADPAEEFKAKVQALTSLMRAWHEAIEGRLTLSISEFELIAQIAKHGGNWATLRAEDPALENALRGIITRHFMHFQPGGTYKKRTQILFSFLRNVGITSEVEQAAARALNTILSEDLATYEYGRTILPKTEAFLMYCRELSLPLTPPLLKASLNRSIQEHFTHFVEGQAYIANSLLLLHFCQRYGFHLMAHMEYMGKPQQWEVLNIEFPTHIFYFSSPQDIIDSPTFITFKPSLKLLEANGRAMTAQAQALTRLTTPKTPAFSPTMTQSSWLPTIPISYFFPPSMPPITTTRPTGTVPPIIILPRPHHGMHGLPIVPAGTALPAPLPYDPRMTVSSGTEHLKFFAPAPPAPAASTQEFKYMAASGLRRY